jgi:outer membrane protease
MSLRNGYKYFRYFKLRYFTVIGICFLFCMTLQVWADESGVFSFFGTEYNVAIEPNIQISQLKMNEKVYQSIRTDKLQSDIIWDLGIQFSIGLGFLVRPENKYGRWGLITEACALWNFPVSEGTLIDADWDLNGNMYSKGTSIVGSIQSNEIKGYLGVSMPLFKRVYIEGGLIVWYGRFSVIAHDGWVQQAASGDVWNDNIEKINLYGTGIFYIQEWICFIPEIKFGFREGKTEYGLCIGYSSFIYGNHIDHHYFRKLDNTESQKYVIYEDKVRGGFLLHLRGDISYNITRKVCCVFFIDYQLLDNSRGDTVIKTTGFEGYQFLEKGMAGALLQIFSGGILWKIIL